MGFKTLVTGGKMSDPLNLGGAIGGKKAKKPKKTSAEIALEKRQASLLDEEIEETEKRLKAMARSKLGYASLVQGVPGSSPVAKATSRPSLIGSASGGGSIVGGGQRVAK